MDGGIDFAISQFFGWGLENNVQRRILDEYSGEQPVGTSMIVETGNTHLRSLNNHIGKMFLCFLGQIIKTIM
jgi:O-acetyl-ADP-ribose deacetylase (regulator of RNase III)